MKSASKYLVGFYLFCIAAANPGLADDVSHAVTDLIPTGIYNGTVPDSDLKCTVQVTVFGHPHDLIEVTVKDENVGYNYTEGAEAMFKYSSSSKKYEVLRSAVTENQLEISARYAGGGPDAAPAIKYRLKIQKLEPGKIIVEAERKAGLFNFIYNDLEVCEIEI